MAPTNRTSAKKPAKVLVKSSSRRTIRKRPTKKISQEASDKKTWKTFHRHVIDELMSMHYPSKEDLSRVFQHIFKGFPKDKSDGKRLRDEWGQRFNLDRSAMWIKHVLGPNYDDKQKKERDDAKAEIKDAMRNLGVQSNGPAPADKMVNNFLHRTTNRHSAHKRKAPRVPKRKAKQEKDESSDDEDNITVDGSVADQSFDMPAPSDDGSSSFSLSTSGSDGKRKRQYDDVDGNAKQPRKVTKTAGRETYSKARQDQASSVEASDVEENGSSTTSSPASRPSNKHKASTFDDEEYQEHRPRKVNKPSPTATTNDLNTQLHKTPSPTLPVSENGRSHHSPIIAAPEANVWQDRRLQHSSNPNAAPHAAVPHASSPYHRGTLQGERDHAEGRLTLPFITDRALALKRGLRNVEFLNQSENHDFNQRNVVVYFHGNDEEEDELRETLRSKMDAAEAIGNIFDDDFEPPVTYAHTFLAPINSIASQPPVFSYDNDGIHSGPNTGTIYLSQAPAQPAASHYVVSARPKEFTPAWKSVVVDGLPEYEVEGLSDTEKGPLIQPHAYQVLDEQSADESLRLDMERQKEANAQYGMTYELGELLAPGSHMELPGLFDLADDDIPE